MRRFRRYVAIGDSTTEGMEDPDGAGGYRGWADRLAEHVARAQDEPVEYANLAVRGLRVGAIRATQLDQALSLDPDLMTIVGGVNDVIGPRPDFERVRAELTSMFGAARARDVTVLTFTMPDPSSVNPLGRHLRQRMFRLNTVIRAEAERHGVLVMDFDRYAIGQDRRLWFDDRLHVNSLGHERIGAALAWRLGLDGTDESWAEPLPAQTGLGLAVRRAASDIAWVVSYLAPWLGRSIRGIPHSAGVVAKRPVPTIVSRPDS
ncbi:lysophospholipase L1-like esterase [Microlunatus panaciterrae]|uniref:Lysophospholipase L1-like esterase n=1 Tax=Microlunatus panaciterrae TaxID=400768 RepID=A0ABS2RJA1_9ACTN|nr:lysophospholipase L1-like esterase [Microlunatus panaciterrae]